MVRELTTKLDKAEKDIVNERLAEYKKQIEVVNTKVEELKQTHQNQKSLLDDLAAQRDMYKSMAESNCDKSTPKENTDSKEQTTNLEVVELKIRAEEAEAAYEETKANFNVYHKERMVQEKTLEDKLSKPQGELNENRSKNMKLAFD